MATQVETKVRVETIVYEAVRCWSGEQTYLMDMLNEHLNELRQEGEIRCLTPLWVTIDHEAEKVVGSVIVEVTSSG